MRQFSRVCVPFHTLYTESWAVRGSPETGWIHLPRVRVQTWWNGLTEENLRIRIQKLKACLCPPPPQYSQAHSCLSLMTARDDSPVSVKSNMRFLRFMLRHLIGIVFCQIYVLYIPRTSLFEFWLNKVGWKKNRWHYKCYHISPFEVFVFAPTN